jgi:hypothetical protein
LRWFICSGAHWNAAFLQAYLDPFNAAPPPPTTPQLMSQFVNPRSDESPPRFLASFGGECSTRGYGYLGGDPSTQSIYHVKWFNKPCFAPGGFCCYFDRSFDHRARRDESCMCHWCAVFPMCSPFLRCVCHVLCSTYQNVFGGGFERGSGGRLAPPTKFRIR